MLKSSNIKLEGSSIPNFIDSSSFIDMGLEAQKSKDMDIHGPRTPLYSCLSLLLSLIISWALASWLSLCARLWLRDLNAGVGLKSDMFLLSLDHERINKHWLTHQKNLSGTQGCIFPVVKKFGEIPQTWWIPGPLHNGLFNGIENRVFVLSVFQSEGKNKAQSRLAERTDDFLVSQQMASVVE